MITGNGLLASAFENFRDNNNVHVFASGVSYSGETDECKYEREQQMLEHFSQDEKLLVYFSTCSIFDPSLKGSRYVKHKIDMEKLLCEKFRRFLCVRLPNIVGKGGNPYTMVNYFSHAIAHGKPLFIQNDAYRYFIDINDVVNCVSQIVTEGGADQQTVSVFHHDAMKITELVTTIEDVKGQRGQYSVVNGGGGRYDVPGIKHVPNRILHAESGVKEYVAQALRNYI